MFTGIIKEVGQVKEINSKHGDIQIMFSSQLNLVGLVKEGDSISVNGVCLTAYNVTEDTFCTDVSNQTLDVTNIASLRSGDNVNLDVELITPIAMEQELRFAIREGGHTVGAGVVTAIVE